MSLEYSLSRSLSQTMIAEYKTKLIDKSIPQRKLAELYDIAERRVEKLQQGLRSFENVRNRECDVIGEDCSIIKTYASIHH